MVRTKLGIPGLQVKGIRRLEDGAWKLQYVTGSEDAAATATHGAVLLADIMTVRLGAYCTLLTFGNCPSSS